jgi:hypothetical protein
VAATCHLLMFALTSPDVAALVVDELREESAAMPLLVVEELELGDVLAVVEVESFDVEDVSLEFAPVAAVEPVAEFELNEPEVLVLPEALRLPAADVLLLLGWVDVALLVSFEDFCEPDASEPLVDDVSDDAPDEVVGCVEEVDVALLPLVLLVSLASEPLVLELLLGLVDEVEDELGEVLLVMFALVLD